MGKLHRMKLKQRLWLLAVGAGVLTICLLSVNTWILPLGTILSEQHKKSVIDNPDDYSKFSMGRNLNMASREHIRNLPDLLSRVEDLGALYSQKWDDSRQLLDTLLQNKSLSEALISIGHILEKHQHKRTLAKEATAQDAVLSVIDLSRIDNGTAARKGINTGTNGSRQGPQRQRDDLMLVQDSFVRDLQTFIHKIEYKRNDVDQQKIILPGYVDIPVSERSPSFRRFHAQITPYELYPKDSTVVDTLLEDMASQPFITMSQKSGGTQLKLTFTLKDHGRAMFKPMRFPRNQETLPNHFYFSDYERHNAEIAAFHLDRLLGFRRVPPTSGRVINITYDIWKYADTKFEKTIFISPAGNVCFHGHCDYYCDTGHAICGRPDLLEGSFSVYLPDSDIAQRSRWRHPWRRSYHKRRKAAWEKNPKYCDDVKTTPPYQDGRRLLDIMDMAVFDFLTGNMDRHHYETFMDFDNDTFPILFDNGRGFGKASYDEITILAPIYQCCLVRASTLNTLLNVHTGPHKLSQIMKQSLKKDKLDPILTERHLLALDRRLGVILLVLYDCVSSHGVENVVIADGF